MKIKLIKKNEGIASADEIFGMSLADKAKTFVKYCEQLFHWKDASDAKPTTPSDNLFPELYQGFKKWLVNEYPKDNIRVKMVQDWTSPARVELSRNDIHARYQKCLDQAKCGLKVVGDSSGYLDIKKG